MLTKMIGIRRKGMEMNISDLVRNETNEVVGGGGGELKQKRLSGAFDEDA